MTCTQVLFYHELFFVSCLLFQLLIDTTLLFYNLCTVQSFSAPASVEPSTAPHSKSYMEVRSFHCVYIGQRIYKN